MTKVIYYADSNNIRKNADSFVKAGDYQTLAKEITSDCVILADDVNDSFLKGLSESYDVKVRKASDVRDGLTSEQEALAKYHRDQGANILEISKLTGFDFSDVLNSNAVNGAESRFEKILR